jgi:glycosyltransferase involved in cell wall biosynthesis
VSRDVARRSIDHAIRNRWHSLEVMTESVDANGSPRSDPLVSVVVPAFNAAAYLGAALDSLRAQTVRELEIIVIDDGSSDDTAAVARRHASEDPRVCVISRETPSGRPASARNAGLRVARGKYIALLDADDTCVPTRIEKQVRAMELTGSGFAFADVQRFYADTGTLAHGGTLALAGFVERASRYLEPVANDVYLCSQSFGAFLLTYVAIVTSTVMFSRELLTGDETWFDESLVCFEDLDLWMRWADRTRFVFVNEVQVIMRKHSASLTGSQPLETRIDGIGVRRKHLRRLAPVLSADEVRAAERNISELQFHVAYAQWCAGRGQHARKWYLDSWRSRATTAAALGYLKALVPRSGTLGLLANVRRTLAPDHEARH